MDRFSRLRPLCLAFVGWLSLGLAQAQQLIVIKNTVEPSWSENGQVFWFASKLGDQRSEWILVNAQAGTRERLFDHEAVAKAIGEKTGKTIDPTRLSAIVTQVDLQQQLVELAVQGVSLSVRRSDGQVEWKAATNENPSSSQLFLPPRPSEQGGGQVHFQVQNQLSEAIEVVWIDFTGSPQVYATTEPKQSFQSSSFANHVWLFRTAAGKELGCIQLPNADETKLEVSRSVIDAVQINQTPPRRERGNRARNRNRRAADISPSKEWRAEVRDHNLWLVQNDKAQSATNAVASDATLAVALTTDATESNSFHRSVQRDRLLGMQYDAQDFPASRPDVDWTSDGKYLIGWQATVVPERKVQLIHSHPKNGQPALIEYPYAKPGDTIPIRLPRLFDVAGAKEIPIARDLFPDPWEVRLERISDDGQVAWFYFNARGHQTIQVVRIELSTGASKVVINETSPTFLHYSARSKYSLRWLGDQTAIWSSERSGWNHLYRIDMHTGQILNAVTSGDWNVKRLSDVRDDIVTFYAVGIDPDQDPYHEHYCRVHVDGTQFTRLTTGDGTHSVSWSPTREYFIDRYSRVDLPPVHELRRALDGSLICQVEKSEVVGDNTPEQLRIAMPERFVAPGRDGQTAIWGIVHWPKDYDPAKKYPVIESIYAGPHDHHVPKAFRGNRAFSDFTSAGFVVVQIDGMGTAWRSKAFHDVAYRNLKDAGFPDRIAWLRALGAKYPSLDLTRVGIFGGSAGGQNAMAALLWHNDFYKVAVADCGCHDNRMDKIWWNEQWMGKVEPGDHYARNSNRENAHLLKGHLMLVVGELDHNVDPASTTQVVSKLIEAQKTFDFLLMTGADHGACESPYGRQRRLSFFKKYLLDSNRL